MPPTALFVVDIQFELASDPETEIPKAAEIRRAGAAILTKARSAIDDGSKTPRLEIIVVQHEELPDEGTLVRGSRAWELVFPPRDGQTLERKVTKNVGNTFESNPNLASQLQARGVETIVVFGIQSEMCVRSTAIGAIEAGFKVKILSGAHSTYDSTESGKKAEQIELEVEEELRKRGVEIIPWMDWNPQLV